MSLPLQTSIASGLVGPAGLVGNFVIDLLKTVAPPKRMMGSF